MPPVAGRSVLVSCQCNNPERRFRSLTDACLEPAWLAIAVRKVNAGLVDRLKAGMKQIQGSGEYRRIQGA